MAPKPEPEHSDEPFYPSTTTTPTSVHPNAIRLSSLAQRSRLSLLIPFSSLPRLYRNRLTACLVTILSPGLCSRSASPSSPPASPMSTTSHNSRLPSPPATDSTGSSGGRSQGPISECGSVALRRGRGRGGGVCLARGN